MQLVIRNKSGQIINIGPWDYQHSPVMGPDTSRPRLDRNGAVIGYEQMQVGTVPLNPLPAGAYEDQVEVVEGVDGGKYAAEDYRALRRAAYPSVRDQLDALYHAGLIPPPLSTELAAVKNEYPKAVEVTTPSTTQEGTA